jgi:hypothetical protein
MNISQVSKIMLFNKYALIEMLRMNGIIIKLILTKINRFFDIPFE